MNSYYMFSSFLGIPKYSEIIACSLSVKTEEEADRQAGRHVDSQMGRRGGGGAVLRTEQEGQKEE